MTIIFSPQAEKFLRKADKKTARRILDAISGLPGKGDRKKLTSRRGYRMRVGDYRVIYDQDGNVLEIIKVGHRKDVYDN